eukprot:Nitzschia sp. Nitz4//scaffold20_size174350//5335//6417//NITZ4_002074-RA/size174350-processed-gene-0.80-mRNA-1//-1//CDS//3329541725//6219//frame0
MTLLPIISLGSQGLKVTQMGYGCMGLTTAYGSKLPDQAISDILGKVYANGINFWDTANLYCFADPWRLLKLQSPLVCQEEKMAPMLHKIGRDNIVVATKTGIELSIFPKLRMTANGDPTFIRKQCEDSLRRLEIDCIDLFYLHRIDETIPIERSMMEMKRLVEEGKIKYVGLSECSAETIRRAHKIHPITCVQMEYSLWCRGIEKEVLPTCKELGIGLVAYSPLGRGFFAGAHKEKMTSGDFRKTQERFQEEENHRMFEKVEVIAKEKGVTTAQLALAWVQAQQHRAAGVLAIPGTTKEKNLLSNIAATKLVLSKDDIATLEAAVPAAKGGRYGEDDTLGSWENQNNAPLTPEEAKTLGL